MEFKWTIPLNTLQFPCLKLPVKFIQKRNEIHLKLEGKSDFQNLNHAEREASENWMKIFSKHEEFLLKSTKKIHSVAKGLRYDTDGPPKFL